MGTDDTTEVTGRLLSRPAAILQRICLFTAKMAISRVVQCVVIQTTSVCLEPFTTGVKLTVAGSRAQSSDGEQQATSVFTVVIGLSLVWCRGFTTWLSVSKAETLARLHLTRLSIELVKVVVGTSVPALLK